jgi:hypothetical protein
MILPLQASTVGGRVVVVVVLAPAVLGGDHRKERKEKD